MFVPAYLEVVNTKFLNLKDMIYNLRSSSSKPSSLFDGCYIENVTYVSEGTSLICNVTVVNSYFADGTTMVTKKDGSIIKLGNNWWGKNAQPTYKVGNVNTNPDTWLILALDTTELRGQVQNVSVSFKVTDGENITNYNGSAYPRDFVINVVNGTLDEDNGILVNNTVVRYVGEIGSTYLVETTVDNQTVNLTAGPLYTVVADIHAEDITIVVGENQFNVSVLVNNQSLSGFNITLTLNGYFYEVPVGDGMAIFNINKLSAGNYLLKYSVEDNSVCDASSAVAILNVLRNDVEMAVAVANISVGQSSFVKVTLPSDASGNVSVFVDGNNYSESVVLNGFVNVGLENLAAGPHFIEVLYSGDDKYSSDVVNKKLSVEKLGSFVSADSVNIVEGETANIEVYVNNGATGFVFVTIGDDILCAKINNGKAIFAINNLPAGNHTISFEYNGDNNYNGFTSNAKITVNGKIVPSVDNITIPTDIKSGESNISVDLPSDATGNVSVFVDGKEISNSVVVNGTANITLGNLTAGLHMVEVKYSGDNKYAPKSSSNTITVPKVDAKIVVAAKLTCVAVDYSAGERGSKIYAVLNDDNGKPIANKNVQIVLDGKIYKVTTDKNGKAGLTVSKSTAKSYGYALYFQGDDTYNAVPLALSKLTVTKKKTSIKATSKTFKAKTKSKKITVTLKTIKNKNGKTYLKAGKKLTLKIKDKTYTAKINRKGIAKFTIKLTKKGKYIAKIKFAGDSTYKASSKRIKIKIK